MTTITKICASCLGRWIDYEHSIGTSEEFLEELKEYVSLVTDSTQCESDDHE